MDRLLLDLLDKGYPPRDIAAIMHSTEDAIVWRIKSLGRSVRDGWRSRQEVAAVLGVSRRAVDRWRQDGALRVTMHGRRWTRVTDADLRLFVGSYAGDLFDPESVRDPSLRSLAQTSAIVNQRRAG